MKIKQSQKGFTLAELMAVLSILCIIVAIALPSIGRVMVRSERESCQMSVQIIERHYHSYLIIEQLDHSHGLFTEFLNQHIDQSSDKHVYRYVDSRVQCAVHADNTVDLEDDQPPVQEVSWL